MGAITQFLKKDVVFEPHDIKAMSMALDDVCKSLHLLHRDPAREVIAERIIALATLACATRSSCAIASSRRRASLTRMQSRAGPIDVDCYEGTA